MPLPTPATASAEAPDDSSPVSAPSTATVTIAADPELTLEKTASVGGNAVAGDIVSYEFLVTNTGNVTVSDITIDETIFSGSGSLGEITCPATTLDADEDTTCTATYALTQQDVDAGVVDNTAVATGDPAGPMSTVQSDLSSASVTTTIAPLRLALVKTADRESARAGDKITYTYSVTNTGTVSVAGVAITETAFTGSGPIPAVTCPGGSVLPGAELQCTATYDITSADAQSGTVSNTAVAMATAPDEVVDPVSDPSTALLSVIPPQPLATTGSTIALTGASLAVLLLVVGTVVLISAPPPRT